jgi:energy-coupling factor transport system permease protein
MELDPRTKLILVCTLTTLAVIKTDILYLLIIVFLAFILALLVKYNFIRYLRKMKRLMLSFLIIFLIQILFNKTGEPLIEIGNFVLIASGGLNSGFQFILRMLIIIMCGGILSTTNSRKMIQGLILLKLPYELAFMVTTSISFIPLLSEEIQDTLIALKLKGVNIKKIPLGKKVSTFTYLFFPIIMNTIEKSKELSISLELRGFRQSSKRTSRMILKIQPKDITLIGISSVIFITLLFI